ncbi:MAG: alpha/beta hydrolase [Betaproteobacteria bacterium]|nr:alpha/beta hydrolase [Betaproteobacteria bacterium]MCL2886204.1 alpha/beta hydrolase [Betaproteobacteria bacterium]
MMRHHSRFLPYIIFFVFSLAGQASAADQSVWREAEFDGIKVAYLEAGKADAPALVFIPGWTGDASSWKLQIPVFSKSYRVIAVDPPGFGRSDKPHDRAYTLEFFARALQAVIQDARATSPVLVGHSMGYSVIRQYLISFPGTARAVVNVDGAHFRIPEAAEARADFEKMVDGMVASYEGPDRKAALRRSVKSLFYGKTPKALQDEIMNTVFSADVYAANSAFRELLRLDQWQEISFDVPCLALYANVPPDHEAGMRAVFPRLTYELWDDTGHFLMLEKPERFNIALARFIALLP